MQRLDNLMQEESLTVAAQGLRVTHGVDKRVMGIGNDVQGVGDRVNAVDDRVRGVRDRIDVVIDGAYLPLHAGRLPRARLLQIPRSSSG